MVKVKNLSHEGRGIAHYENGKTIFIRNALPEETVEFQLTKKRRQFDEAKATEIVEPSPLRITPKCNVFNICGGCSLQHLAPESQIALKQDWLAEKLTQLKLEPQTWLAPLQAKVWGYRHKARLGVRYVRKRDEVLVGFREAESNFLTNMGRCEVLHPSVGEHIDEIKTMLTSLTVRETIPQIEVAVDDTHTALIIRHLEPIPGTDLEKLKALHDKLQYVVFLQPKGLDSIHQIFPTEPVSLNYQLPNQAHIHFKPTDFAQVNFSLNPLMIQQALQLLNPQKDETVLDLFCGLGNFTLPIASLAKKVIGVEGDAAMLNRAKDNAETQGFDNIEYHTANLFDFDEQAPFSIKVDILLLDPPRAGAEAVCTQIKYFAPKRIVYVSCDPSTLVRDLAILVHQHGYTLQSIGVMDMFPHTSHVESMALLEKTDFLT